MTVLGADGSVASGPLRDAARAAALPGALDLVLSGESQVVADAYAARDDAWFVGVAAVAAFLARRFDLGAQCATRARELARPDDREAVLMAAAASGFAVAGGADFWTDSDDQLGDALGLIESESTSTVSEYTDAQWFTRWALAEAALDCGRLDLGAAFVAATGPLRERFLDRGGVPHPYIVVIRVMRVRLLAFRGRITEADELLVGIEDVTLPPLAALIVQATESLVRGNASERAEVRALADRVEFARPTPDDYLSSGCYLLAAFGLVAVGDVRRAARLALRAGIDEDLSGYDIVDRGLAFELLVAAAALEGDLDSAEAWWARAEPLLESRIADSSTQRVRSRLELLRGDAAAAVVWADRAVASAKAQGRSVEAAEGEIVAARARISASQAGEASIRLEALADEAKGGGHLAARRAAARELRTVGRRLRPVAGSDWGGLSLRERDIALMVAEGLSNREIAHDLHLSEHTVRAHVSRVLAAFGAASRFAVAARVAELFPATSSPEPAALTPRQEAVAERIARGAGNAEISIDLGLSIKTIEKHIGEIFRRWDVSSRVGIARVWRSRSTRPPGEGRSSAGSALHATGD